MALQVAPTEEFIRTKYVEEDLTRQEVADILNIPKRRLRTYLEDYGIRKKSQYRPRETKECQVCGEEFSIYAAHNDQIYCSSECYGKTMEGTERTEKAREKISRGMEQAHREGRHDSGRNIETVPQTGHTVSSSWEKEIDLLLYNSGIDYLYEGVQFNIDGRTYTPDFSSGNVVIEVKGTAGYIYKPEYTEKKAQYMVNMDDTIYVVIGVELPADIYVEWEDKDILPEVIKENRRRED